MFTELSSAESQKEVILSEKIFLFLTQNMISSCRGDITGYCISNFKSCHLRYFLGQVRWWT